MKKVFFALFCTLLLCVSTKVSASVIEMRMFVLSCGSFVLLAEKGQSDEYYADLYDYYEAEICGNLNH